MTHDDSPRRSRSKKGARQAHASTGTHAEHEPVTEVELVRLAAPNVQNAQLSPCQVDALVEAVREQLTRHATAGHNGHTRVRSAAPPPRAAEPEGEGDADSDGEPGEQDCWLVSSTFGTCTYANGETGTCRFDYYECVDGSSYTIKTPLG